MIELAFITSNSILFESYSPLLLRRTFWGYGFYRIQSDGEVLAGSIKSQADGATSGLSSSSESTSDDSVDTNSERFTQPSFLQLEEHPGLALQSKLGLFVTGAQTYHFREANIYVSLWGLILHNRPPSYR